MNQFSEQSSQVSQVYLWFSISINELIPTANEYAGKKLSTYGIVIGMFVMAVSLFTFYVKEKKLPNGEVFV